MLLVAGFVAPVLLLRLAALRVVRRADPLGSTRRYNRLVALCRIWVAVWLGVCVHALGWHGSVASALGVIDKPWLPLSAVFVLAVTFPALAAWVGLWWAQYPVDLHARELDLLARVEHDLAPHQPPPLRPYLLAHVRHGLLFLLVPILAVLVAADVGAIAVQYLVSRTNPNRELFAQLTLIPAAGLVYLLAPEILKRILKTRPLPDGPLRRRLEAVCRAVRLRCRDILLWDTQYSMGNAAVMGVIPRFRYIMLSDLLIETLHDRQIEAVFAHEAGHVVHHHMAWYIVFFVAFTLGSLGPGQALLDWASPWLVQWKPAASLAPLLATLGGFGCIFVLFGVLSRRFERQADVFAARMIQTDWGSNPPDGAAPPVGPALTPRQRLLARSWVGEEGAGVFSGALERVAVVNNMPIAARSWCHGSIARRMRSLLAMSRHPRLTMEFDNLMRRVFAVLSLALVLMAVWVFIRPPRLGGAEVGRGPTHAHSAAPSSNAD